MRNVKAKGQVFPVQAKRHIGEVEDIAPLVLDLGSRWRRVVSLTHPALPPWEGVLHQCN